MKKIKECWRYDYLAVSGKVELVPVSWLKELMLDPKIYTPTTVDTDGNLVGLADLQKHLEKEGLFHAGVVEVSREGKTARLVAGNHRIQVFENMGISYFPIYVVVRDAFDDGLGNGIEISENLTDLIERTVGDVIEAPSKIFRDIMDLKYKGFLPA